jgi:hypothetical protein
MLEQKGFAKSERFDGKKNKTKTSVISTWRYSVRLMPEECANGDKRIQRKINDLDLFFVLAVAV